MVRKSGLSSVFFAAAMALPLISAPVSFGFAQEGTDRDYAASSANDNVITAGTQTHLAYIRTGNNGVDQMTEAGLRGLGIMLFERTAIENTVQVPATEENPGGTAYAPVGPVGIDLERDELAFYPVIFWTIDPGQALPSDKAIRNLNNYMRNGGLLVIDTRDQTTSGRGAGWLRRLDDRGLAIGDLAAVKGCADTEEECHVLGKSFYLMESFPGRYAGGQLWVEKNPGYARDRVSPVVIGGNEWTAAWATDEDGRYLYAVHGDEEQREQAFRFGINLVMYALTGNYKADMIHAPAILERMGPK